LPRDDAATHFLQLSFQLEKEGSFVGLQQLAGTGVIMTSTRRMSDQLRLGGRM
jgi:hypothetical protein